ncbi:MAG: DUF5618 family protein [bacterium]
MNMKKKFATPKSPKEAFAEAKALYENARETLKKSPVEFDAYKKPKYVKEASAMAYLAALRAIDGYLLSMGTLPDKLPTSIIEYEKALRRIPKNGKLMVALEIAYQNLYIFGYYRGGIGVKMIKEGFSKAKFIIDTLSNKLTGSNSRSGLEILEVK